MTEVKQLITEHLDIWLTAETEKKSGRGRSTGSSDKIYGVQKLRDLIFGLAVRGFLSSQNTRDESALFYSSNLNSSKNIKRDNDELEPYPIPENWKFMRINQCAYLKSGISIDKNSENINGEYIYCKVSDMNLSENMCEINTSVTYINANERELNQAIDVNSIIFPKRGGAIATNKKRFVNQRIFIDPNIMAITPSNFLNIKYLMVWLNNIDLSSLNTGTSVPQINNKDIEPLWIAVPPIEEQQRIVEKVDELMQLCDLLDQQQILSSDAHATLVDTLLKALTESSDADEFQDNWQRIVANFDVLFTTEYSIEQLKQTVLQLAVMGKLVKQDLSDEPASELLKKIADEKAKLIKEGKIKKSKPLPEISEDEKPFELPIGWEWVHLLQIGMTSTGKTPSTKNQHFFEGNIPFVGPGQITNNNVMLTPDKYLSEEGLMHSTEANSGDILCVCIGGSIGKSLLLKERVSFNQQLNCLSNIQSNKDYIYYAMQTSIFIKQILEKATGSATPIINKGKWEEIIIPLPPYNEQKRIVEKVNQLFSIIDQLQVLQSKLQKTKLHLADALVANAVEGV